MLDVVDRRGKGALIDAGKPSLHFLRIQSRKSPVDGEHGNVDAREDIGRRARDDDHACDENYQGKHYEGVRSI
jgi:hypothetical protein